MDLGTVVWSCSTMMAPGTSFDKARDESVSARWAEEVESRIEAYEAGNIQADSAEDVLSRINQR